MSAWSRSLLALAGNPRLTVAERAKVDQVAAGALEFDAAVDLLGVALYECAGALRELAATWAAIDFRQALDEDEVLATHPDLAEADAAMDGWWQ